MTATSAPRAGLVVAVGEQPLADRLRVDVRDLATEEVALKLAIEGMLLPRPKRGDPGRRAPRHGR